MCQTPPPPLALAANHLLMSAVSDGCTVAAAESGATGARCCCTVKLSPYLNYTLSRWTLPIDGAQLSCSCPSGQSDKQAVCFGLSLHLVLLRV